MMVQGLLLGIANGPTCLAYCAPTLMPYLLGEGGNARQNGVTLLRFLLGRLLGYLLFAAAAWQFRQSLLPAGTVPETLTGGVYILLAAALAGYVLTDYLPRCPGHGLYPVLRRITARCPGWFPALMGLFTGLNLCPPFLLTLAQAGTAESLPQSLLFFLAFFTGTALYFLPLPLVGALSRHSQVRWIGKMTALLIALYYLYDGILILIQGGMS